MPNIKSATKRMHLSRKWAEKNRQSRGRVRTLVRKVRQAKDAETAEAHLTEATSLLDRAGRKRLYHPNRVARIKSQLQRHVNELKEG